MWFIRIKRRTHKLWFERRLIYPIADTNLTLQIIFVLFYKFTFFLLSSIFSYSNTMFWYSISLVYKHFKNIITLFYLSTYKHLSRWGITYFSTTAISSFFFIMSFNSWMPYILPNPKNIKILFNHFIYIWIMRCEVYINKL